MLLCRPYILPGRWQVTLSYLFSGGCILAGATFISTWIVPKWYLWSWHVAVIGTIELLLLVAVLLAFSLPLLGPHYVSRAVTGYIRGGIRQLQYRLRSLWFFY